MHRSNTETVQKSLPKRYRSEFLFKAIGLGAIIIGLLLVFMLFYNIISKGYSAFTQTYVELPIFFDPEVIDPKGERVPEVLSRADYSALIKKALRDRFPEVNKRKEKRKLYKLVSSGAAYHLKDMVIEKPDLIGRAMDVRLLADDEFDMYIKGYVTKSKEYVPGATATVSGDSGTVSLKTDQPVFKKLMDEARSEARNAIKALLRNLEVHQSELAGAEEALMRHQERLDEAQEYEHAAAIEKYSVYVKDTQDVVDGLRSTIDLGESKVAAIGAALKDEGGVLARADDSASVIININGGAIKASSVSETGIEGETLIPLKSVGPAEAGSWSVVTLSTPEGDRRVSDKAISWIESLKSEQAVQRQFNTVFFTSGDSREPEQAGIAGALMGSLLTLIVTLALSFPIGVAAAIYLEEFAPKNRLSDLIEVNINNLAAVPSIVFGLLGLAVFINFFGMPRSAPIVGGMVLTLMTLPTIIIASRAALKSVPPSIREAALGMGASQMQTVFHHVLPLAMPGMLTGSIIGMAQALGETAPLLMIGMVAFIVDIPASVFDPSTVLPVQVYLWADSPERAFVERTSAAIMVLLGFLVVMNLLAVLLRKKFERRW